jgi:hypothetical protein
MKVYSDEASILGNIRACQVALLKFMQFSGMTVQPLRQLTELVTRGSYIQLPGKAYQALIMQRVH